MKVTLYDHLRTIGFHASCQKAGAGNPLYPEHTIVTFSQGDGKVSLIFRDYLSCLEMFKELTRAIEALKELD